MANKRPDHHPRYRILICWLHLQ